MVYWSKAQSINALSSTESELIAAVTDANTDKFLRSMIREIVFPKESPTTIYEDRILILIS